MKWISKLFNRQASEPAEPQRRNEPLPTFRYHPDPIATGVIKPSDAVCPCCGMIGGYEYSSSIYSKEEVESVCPWCIADGSAAEKFDAMFTDYHPLIKAGIPGDIFEAVVYRTPGYDSWQQEEWLSCCGDACAFHGDISKQELHSLPDETLSQLWSGEYMQESHCREIIEYYRPQGDPAIYKFVCLHCKQIRLGMDFS